jgi:hypothetical protein
MPNPNKAKSYLTGSTESKFEDSMLAQQPFASQPLYG